MYWKQIDLRDVCILSCKLICLYYIFVDVKYDAIDTGTIHILISDIAGYYCTNGKESLLR